MFSSCKPTTTKSYKYGSSQVVKNNDKYLRWNPNQLPLNLVVSEDLVDLFDSEDDDYFGNNPIEQMLDIWNLSHSNINFFNLPTVKVSNLDLENLTQYKDTQIGIYKSDTWFPDISNNALAITQYFARRRNQGLPSEYLELIHADIIINYRYYQFSKDPEATGVYHLPSVILHELGHLLGLSHQNNYDLEAVMSPYMSIIDVYDGITNNDVDRVKYKYDDSKSGREKNSELILGASQSTGKNSQIVRGIIELKANGKCNHIIKN